MKKVSFSHSSQQPGFRRTGAFSSVRPELVTAIGVARLTSNLGALMLMVGLLAGVCWSEVLQTGEQVAVKVQKPGVDSVLKAV